jgi:hypothetical protein
MSSLPDSIFATRWVHVFEEDSAEGRVFRPDSTDIPLSRRPREQLGLQQDGSAQLFLPGPDDRLRAVQASWSEQGDTVVIKTADTSGRTDREMRVVSHAPDRLVLRP